MDYARDRINTLIARNTKILIGIVVVLFIAAGLQTAGYATPGWVVFSGTNDDNVTFSAGIGLWYQRICYSDECETGLLVSAVIFSEEEQNEFETFKLIATLAVVCSLFSPVIVLVWIRRVRLQLDIITSAGSAILVTLIGGVLSLVVVGKIADDVHTAYDHWVKTEDTDFKLGFLYSELLMGLGGALDCLAFIGMCLEIAFRNWTKRIVSRSAGVEEECVGMKSDMNMSSFRDE